MSLSISTSAGVAGNSSPTQMERRINRSTIRATALELMLEAVRHRHDLDAVLVADDHGLLLAGSDAAGIDLDNIAAALLGGPHKDQIPNLGSFAFELDLTRLYAGAIGAAPELNSALAEVALSAKRILAQ